MECVWGRGMILISLDVSIALFTNIPKELVMNSIKKRWHYMKKNAPYGKINF